MPLKPDSAILATEGLTMRFKGLVAVNDVSFAVEPGSITALIGPNGAGKTTLFNCISGFLHASTGAVTFAGDRIDTLPPHRRSQRGLVRTFQIPRIFHRLTLLENMLVADREQPGEALFGCFYRRGLMHERTRAAQQKARELLTLLGIDRLADEYAGTLSGGQRKLLELGRVLMTDPRMILLDEPMAGVNPALGLRLLERVEQLRRDRGLTFFFVEHDMDVVMRVSDRVLVLDEGSLIADSPPAAIRSNERVIDAYLGRAAEAAQT
jgi:ABC-type branched-subunit amino acid transport system ATPase component